MAEPIQQKIIQNLQQNNQRTNAPQSSGDVAAKKLFDDFDDFLKLLTEQLKHQDPLSPLETSEFTNQLVGFANVEQSLAQTRQLEKVTTSLESQNKISAMNHIGLLVEYEGADFYLEGETADIGYELPEHTGSAQLVIYDADDDVVARYRLPPNEEGKQTFRWDGYRVADVKPADRRGFQLVIPEGETSGEAEFEYQLPRNAGQATITIRDAQGNIVATENLVVSENRETFTWDGRGRVNGVEADMPAGAYTYQINVLPRTGQTLGGLASVFEPMPAGAYRTSIGVKPASGHDNVEGSVTYYSKARVKGVASEDGEITLRLNTGKDLTIDKVLQASL